MLIGFKYELGSLVIWILMLVTCQELEEDELAEPWQDHCEEMDPGNKTYQTGPFPFHLILNPTSIHCLQGVHITLRAPPPLTFQGFMVQGRDAKTGEAVGEFDTEYEDVKIINCFGRPDSAAMHDTNSTKTEVHMRWAPDIDDEQDITFFVTVAETVDPVEKYWACQRAASLHITKSPYKTPSPPPGWDDKSSTEEDIFRGH